MSGLPDWEKIAEFVHSFTHERDRKIPPKEIKELVELHGWEAIGALVSAFKDHRDVRILVDAGVPFEEAHKLFVGKRTEISA